MNVQIEPSKESHGQMPWTGEFRGAYAVFTCPTCGRSIGLCAGREPPIQFYDRGNQSAGHQAYVTLDVLKAALEQEIWPQAPQNHDLIEAWEQDGGGPPFTIGRIGTGQ